MADIYEEMDRLRETISPTPWAWQGDRITASDGEAILWLSNAIHDTAEPAALIGACGERTEKLAAKHARILAASGEMYLLLSDLLLRFNEDHTAMKSSPSWRDAARLLRLIESTP